MSTSSSSDTIGPAVGTTSLVVAGVRHIYILDIVYLGMTGHDSTIYKCMTRDYFVTVIGSLKKVWKSSLVPGTKSEFPQPNQ